MPLRSLQYVPASFMCLKCEAASEERNEDEKMKERSERGYADFPFSAMRQRIEEDKDKEKNEEEREIKKANRRY